MQLLLRLCDEAMSDEYIVHGEILQQEDTKQRLLIQWMLVRCFWSHLVQLRRL